MKLSGVKKKRDDVASRRRCVWGPGQGPPEFWSLAFSYFYQKRWFSQFRMGKMNFHHFLFRYTPGKNPCDTRGRSPSRGEEKCPMTTQLKELLTLGIHGWSTTLGVSFFVVFIYLENMRNLCFHDFSWFSKTSGMVPELFCKNVPESLHIQSWGTTLPRVNWCATDFVHLDTLTY